jgi:hypothetical protein
MASPLTIQPDGAAGNDTMLVPSADYMDSYFSSSQGPFVGYPNSGWGVCRMLIKFDLSGIPAGATITGAVLTLIESSNGFPGAGYTITVNRILAANSGWIANCTWNHANPSTVHWAGDTGNNHGADAGCSVSGTDFSATVMGSKAVDYINAPPITDNFTLNLTEFGLMWANNYGMVVWITPSPSYNIQVYSSNWTTAAQRPKLVVTYTEGGGGVPKQQMHYARMRSNN